jgi:hypothetical protein
VVLKWVDSLRYKRMPAIGSITIRACSVIVVPPLCARVRDDLIIFTDYGFHTEAFTHLGTCSSRGSYQDLVQDSPSRAVRDGRMIQALRRA